MFERKIPVAAARAPVGAGQSRPVRLRSVGSELARLRALIHRGLRAELQTGEAAWRVEVTEARPCGPAQAGPALMLQTPGGPITLAPARDMVRALTAIDLAGDAEGDPLHALRLELAAQAMPEGWFELLGASTLLSGAPDTAGSVEVSLTLVRPDARRAVSATLQASGEVLLQALSKPAWQRFGAAASPLPRDWKLRVPVPFGQAEVPLRACRALAPGDVVVMARTHFDLEGHGDLRIGSRSARCTLHLGNQVRVELTEWHATTMDSTMHETTATDSPVHGNDDVALDDVPVLLSFELGALELPLSEVTALGPGSIVPLAGPLPPEVVICAAGRRIGTGELVELEGRLGVEIRRIGA